MAESNSCDLVHQIKLRNVDALATWCEQNRPRLLGALERKVGAGLRRRVELEDILQESLVRAIRDLPHTQLGDLAPLAWFYQVMDRQIIDLHRFHFQAKKRDASREVSADRKLGPGTQAGCFADLLAASLTTPSAAMSRDLRLQRVFQGLDKLPPAMQDAIRWRYLDNLPSKEIAGRLGKSDAATRVLLSRAIRKLQQSVSDLRTGSTPSP